MANPQPDQFTKLSNELLEVFNCFKMTDYERVVIYTIIRKTYGWGKKMDWISHGQISDCTGVSRPHVCRTITGLINKKIIKREGRRIGIQKDWEQWDVDWRVLPEQATGVTSGGNRSVTSDGTHKRKKETNTKQRSEPNGSAQSDLSNKKENMWNTTSDDFADEVAIDLDGDGTLEEKKPQTRKYPNAPAVRKVFQEVLGKSPANWKVNKNQLLACENLYTERGIKAITNALLFAKAQKDTEFCPLISSPYDLDSKWTKLGEFKQKQNGN